MAPPATPAISDVIAVRPYVPQDRSYVIKSWLSSYAGSKVGAALGSVYYQSWARVVEKILGDPTTEVRVAALVDEPANIVGFAVLTPPAPAIEAALFEEPSDQFWTLHYVLVRSHWRGRGVAKLLLNDLQPPLFYTHEAAFRLAPERWKYKSPIPVY
jgi:GNAT superfamily N-acetyltransferase